MKRQAGLWIDHRNAVVVTIVDGAPSTDVIELNVEHQPARVGGAKSTDSHQALHVAHDSGGRRFHGHLDAYYDRVIASIHGAESVLILGPGEAKGELGKRIRKRGHMKAAITVETADKMTDREIEAKLRSSIHI